MRYSEHRPSPHLAEHLECVWFVTDDGVGASLPAERVLPDGCMEWIFHLGARFRRFTPANEWEAQPRSFVVGELTRFLVLQPEGPVSTMGVRFRPGGAYRFLPFPVDLLTDQAIPTGEIWGREGRALEELVLNARTDQQRVQMVHSFLMKQLVLVEPRPRFDAAVNEIMRTRGQARVDRIADSIGWSRRQLQREFRASAGLSPKAMARIIRFQNLLRLVGEGSLRQWVTLALESGYSDQAHMVREFREFAGHSPTEHRTEPGALAHYLVSPRRLASLLGEAAW